jgi:hypothetical protein
MTGSQSVLKLRGGKNCLPNDHCRTPAWLLAALDHEFRFDFDACPLGSHKKGQDGLTRDWNGKRVFCNPPYSNIAPWAGKALASSALTVFVIPARFDSRWAFALKDSGAEIRMMRRSFGFWNPVLRRKCKPFGGVMIVVVNRLGR